MVGSRVLLWVVIVLVITLFLYTVRGILLPFVIGMVVAALLDPAIRTLRLKGFSRAGAVWTVFLAFSLFMALVIRWVVPLLTAQVSASQERVAEFINTYLFPPTRVEKLLSAPSVKERLQAKKYPSQPAALKRWLLDEHRTDRDFQAFFAEFSSDLAQVGLPTEKNSLIEALRSPEEGGLFDRFIARHRQTLMDLGLPATREEVEAKFKVEQRVKDMFGKLLGGAVTVLDYLLSSALLIVLTPIVTILILLDYDNFKRRFLSWVPPALRPAARDLLSDIRQVISAYVRGLTTSLALYATIMAFLFTFLGVPYSVFLGILIAVLYVMPFFGAIISTGVLALAVLLKGEPTTLFFSMPTMNAYFILCVGSFLIVDRIYDALVHPQIVGRAVRLHPVVSIFVVLSGMALFGLAGMILAFPIAGIIKVILDRLMRYTTSVSEEPLPLPRVPKRHQV
ncbi:MAG: AI-2E family transporter [Fimbriimonadales bacterium]|nr:AI-2E family transporter [Fimbriimonadales bacterium]